VADRIDDPGHEVLNEFPDCAQEAKSGRDLDEKD